VQLLRNALRHHDITQIKRSFPRKFRGEKSHNHLYNYAGILQFFTAKWKWKWLKSQGSKTDKKREWNIILCKHKKAIFLH